jgi:gamma-glutamyltranspeptidase / glutathione hydrolase
MTSQMPGIIAAGDRHTAAAGAAMFEKGGNAVDAAVAAAFASFVAEVGVVHLGGSGLAQVFEPATGRSVVYDFFSDVPGRGRSSLPAGLDFEAVTIDYGPTRQEFYLGRGSVAVPGNIFGLCRLAADYARLPLSALLAPAIRLAEEGVPLSPFQAATCELLRPLYTHTEGMRAIFTANGRMIQAGERLAIPHLAETLRELAASGEESARNGRLARAILADQDNHRGLLTAADLESYQVRLHAPIRQAYRDYEVLLPPPSSTGGALLAFSLKVLGAFELRSPPRHSAAALQVLYELFAATSRARAAWESLLAEVGPDEAIERFLANDAVAPAVEAVAVALQGRRPSPNRPETAGAGNTSHLSVIDGEGMAVSLTTTAGESAGYVVPGTGFIANNMLGEADLHPDGFHTRPAGQRIPTMMAPAIVCQDGQVRLVVGSGGSLRIRSAVLQTLSNFLDYGMPLDAAVNTARVHLDGNILQCEGGYPETAVAGLEALGYNVNRWQRRSIYFGGAHSVARTAAGQLTGAGDDRRDGAVAASRTG